MVKDRLDKRENPSHKVMHYSCHVAIMDLLYAPAHRQDGELAGTKTSLIGPLRGIDLMIHCALNGQKQ